MYTKKFRVDYRPTVIFSLVSFTRFHEFRADTLKARSTTNYPNLIKIN